MKNVAFIYNNRRSFVFMNFAKSVRNVDVLKGWSLYMVNVTLYILIAWSIYQKICIGVVLISMIYSNYEAT